MNTDVQIQQRYSCPSLPTSYSSILSKINHIPVLEKFNYIKKKNQLNLILWQSMGVVKFHQRYTLLSPLSIVLPLALPLCTLSWTRTILVKPRFIRETHVSCTWHWISWIYTHNSIESPFFLLCNVSKRLLYSCCAAHYVCVAVLG